MSPVGEQEGIQARTVWRGLIVLALVLITFVIGVVVTLFAINRHTATDAQAAATDSQVLSCQVGALLVGTPIERQPGQSHAEFVSDVRTVIAMLHALRAADCQDVRGFNVTQRDIRSQLREFRDVAPPRPHHGSPSASSSAPALATTGPPSAAAPSVQGGGGRLSGGGNPGGRPGPPPGGPPPHQPPDCTVEVNPVTGQRVCVNLSLP